MFQQRGYVMLHGFELVQLQIRVEHGEQISALWLLIYEHALAVPKELLFNFQKPLALEHHRQNICGGDVVRIVQLDQLAQKAFRRVFLDRVKCRSGSLIDALPV